MSFGLNKSCCNAMSSGSSSTTKVNCDQTKCSPRCCCHSCCQQKLLNKHTYGILKKACNKIFKDFNRQKCRERYAVFPGGMNMLQTDECPEEPCDCGCYTNSFKGCCCTPKKKRNEGETMILDMEKQFGGQAFFGNNNNKKLPKCTFEQDRSKGGQEKRKSTGKQQPRIKGHTRKNQTKSNAKACPVPNKSQVGLTFYPTNRNVHDHESSLTRRFKPHRFEEVRVCDYLRAQLENRDLRRMY